MSSEVVVYLERLVARLQELLGVGLVGVYAGGSYALGGFDPQRSDLDVAAVTRSSVDVELKQRVAVALRHESLPCPARGLELVLYREPAVLEPTADAAYELNLNTGREMPYRVSFAPGGAGGHWYAIDRAILREHGVTLVGRRAAEIFAPLPRTVVLGLLVESVRWHEQHDARGDDAILNACRAVRYAEEGVWSSKPEAGEWARGRLGEPELVSQALAARLGGTPPSRDLVTAFLPHVRHLLDDERIGVRVSRS